LARLEGGYYDDVWIGLVNDVTGDWDTSAVGNIGRSWCCRFAPKSGSIRTCCTATGTSISIDGGDSPDSKPGWPVLFPLWGGIAI